MLKKIIEIINYRYYNGSLKILYKDVEQEVKLYFLETSEYEFTTADVYRAVGKAYYNLLKYNGFSKKLKKIESDILEPFYSIYALNIEEQKSLDNIETIYKNGNYISVLNKFNIKNDKKQIKKIKKFLGIVFPKKKGSHNE